MISANETDAECYERLLRSFENQPEHPIVPEAERPAQSPVACFTGILREPFTPSGEVWTGGDYYLTHQREHRQGGW